MSGYHVGIRSSVELPTVLHVDSVELPKQTCAIPVILIFRDIHYFLVFPATPIAFFLLSAIYATLTSCIFHSRWSFTLFTSFRDSPSSFVLLSPGETRLCWNVTILCLTCIQVVHLRSLVSSTKAT